MIISEKHKYIFVAVPKTGTTSVEAFLLENDPTAVSNVIQVNGEECRVPTHISARKLREKLGEKFDEYTSFGFVRDPCSKTLSNYFHYRNGRPLRKLKAGEVNSFSIRSRILFAKMLPFWIWSLLYPYRSCCSMLMDEKNELLVDHVGYFENLQNDFKEIVDQLSISGNVVQIPHKNQTKHNEFAAYMRNGFVKKLFKRKVRNDLMLFYDGRETCL